MKLYVRYAVLSERKQMSLKSAVADTYFIKIRPVKKKPKQMFLCCFSFLDTSKMILIRYKLFKLLFEQP